MAHASTERLKLGTRAPVHMSTTAAGRKLDALVNVREAHSHNTGLDGIGNVKLNLKAKHEKSKRNRQA